MLIKTHSGVRQDLQHYKGYPIVGHEFQFLNADDSEYDFSGIQDAVMKIFQKQFGTVVKTFSIDTGEIVRSGNSLIETVDESELNIRAKEYWYETYWINADNQRILLSFGTYDFGATASISSGSTVQSDSGSNDARWGGLWNFAANGGSFPTSTRSGIVYIAEDDHGSIGDLDYVQAGTWMISIVSGATGYEDYEYK